MAACQVPCLAGNRYESRGCVGAQCCPSERCVVTGRQNRPDSAVVASVEDGFVRPVRITSYVRSRCGDCVFAVDLQMEHELRSATGRRVGRWTVCEKGLWRSPASLWALVNHRVPLLVDGPCLAFEARPLELVRPEVVASRGTDRERSRRFKLRRRQLGRRFVPSEYRQLVLQLV